MSEISKNSSSQVVLKVVKAKTDKEVAEKLHRCFGHPEATRFRLVETAGPQWAENANLKKLIEETSQSCETCQIYKKPPAR